jgi:hypothetical protein
MKNSESDIDVTKLFVRGSLLFALLVLSTFASSALAKTSDLKITSVEHAPIQAVNQHYPSNLADEELGATSGNKVGGDFQYPAAPWCYTNYGAFPMRVALPAGVPCQVNVAFPPYVIGGITGF